VIKFQILRTLFLAYMFQDRPIMAMAAKILEHIGPYHIPDEIVISRTIATDPIPQHLLHHSLVDRVLCTPFSY
jgi:hypothetical protein